MDNNLLVRLEDLVNNPTARVPVCLCLDTSGSMGGMPIDELNEGVRLFYEAIREDETALYSAEVSIVTFGGAAQCIVDFASLKVQPNAPTLTANGMTPMGEAVNMGLDLLEQRKDEYKDRGVDYYQPWLVLMTDGAPNGDSAELSRAINRTVDLVNQKKLTVFPIGIGSDADMGVLAQFSPKRPPLKLQGLKFREFFAWLSKSVSKTSQSTPGESVKLDVEGIKGWGEL
ncbi:von Willebrand factor type A domain-containing protein [Peptostreptococcus russellii]|uniref:von Willebrand factor type A domain-containing protein n=1 Tax=Peptostreptococcus russellii TaxID=215200 RepID=A0A2P7Q2E3_9FIRM|nr:VWA domain-containing protein [Peptostreptococcus russellii]PSJ32144.1 von Willebrand factor type A domain-containing protein [Peptostreptococcus russellii]